MIVPRHKISILTKTYRALRPTGDAVALPHPAASPEKAVPHDPPGLL